VIGCDPIEMQENEANLLMLLDLLNTLERNFYAPSIFNESKQVIEDLYGIVEKIQENFISGRLLVQKMARIIAPIKLQENI
jgi:hypothetical protein